MRVPPPGAEIFAAKDPRLAGSVRDRRAHLGVAIGGAGVVPIVALASEEIGFEVAEVIDRASAGDAIDVVVAVAPVGERPVAVDGNGVDGGRRPERIEVEKDIVGAIGGLVAEILRPVGGVGDFRSGTDDRFDVGGEGGKCCDEGIGRRVGTHLRQAAQLRADDDGIDAAGGNSEAGVVQDHAPERPLRGAVVDDRIAGDGELGGGGGADEGCELGRGDRGFVG